ncbi:MAG: tannase/feruloyl esterase family alpha/beta hydrolase, partial [Bryobacteraceae bacterium]|nr:tannase/feruloyl esterase family alpha/beta hydrolase [Bryobacteraceae bacterium]
MRRIGIAIWLAGGWLWGAAVECESLRQSKLTNTTIEQAEKVESGTLNTMRDLPPFCRVAGRIRPTADSDIRFEVWLPLKGWNGKFQGVGNGGYAGSLSLPGLAGAIRQGYASATTDTGHQGGDAKWALEHPEKVIDFGWRAIHEMTVAGKAITKAFYGEAPKRSYFNSCSNGGRQALMEAQRFPEDYDGIIAGAPANYWTRLIVMGMSSMKATLARPETYISAKKLKAIQGAAVEACDARDGVRDGVIEQPDRCQPDYGRLLCPGAENDNCLTAPQLEALKVIYAGPRDSKGARVFPGVSPGGEAEPGGWAAWVT